MLFRNPRALSSALAALGSLQPRALGFLNCVDPSDSASNYYLCALNGDYFSTMVVEYSLLTNLPIMRSPSHRDCTFSFPGSGTKLGECKNIEGSVSKQVRVTSN